MKAFLLAAGKGTRLQPLTFHTPKCLVPICGRPLLEYWFDLFEIYGINDILINTSHLSEKVQEYINGHSRGFNLTLTYEETLLGSGGTIKKNQDFVAGEDSFYIFYADNLTNIRLNNMMRFHKKNNHDFTLAVFRVLNPRECGVVEMDEHSTIVSFIEKPEKPASDLAFAGIILSSSNLVDYFPDRDIFDLGHDVLPRIVGHASGYVIEDYLLDIGTPEKLYQAENDVKNGKINICR
ncbi:MAG: nucleotidyltransferase family protein [Nitrospiraceae bacterium]|nr:MAG: nucleotidyltransferase family protein [Nitrospiraceae bacterium]